MTALRAALLLLAALPAAAAAQVYAQLVIRERVTVRVPTRASPPAALRLWREKKADRCVKLADLAGAVISEPDSVDFILKGGRRVRARLGSACPALDYYSGFYLNPTADGRICADRDAIHSRAGGACTVDRFRTLVPKKSR